MKNILIVDNHAVLLKYASALLEKKGHRVRTAADGLEALDLLQTVSPDIIFIDLIMPNLSGEKLCEIIRSRPHLQGAFLVILSAAAIEDAPRIAGYGADTCIAKGPFNKMRRHILHVVEQVERGCEHELLGRIFGMDDMPGRNITRELLAAKRHRETTLANISEGLMELDRDSRVVYANPAAAAVFGRSEAELLLQDFFAVFGAENTPALEQLKKKAVDTGRVVNIDSPLAWEGKRIELKMIPVDAAHHHPILVVISDVTRQKMLEAQLQRAQKMEALGTLAGGVAHDLNNILSGIVGYPDLILMQLPDDSPLRKPIKAIQESGKKAAAIVQDLLTLARRGVATREVVNLNRLVDQYLKSPEFQALCAYHHGRVALDTDLDRRLLNVNGSAVQLTKAVMNLVSNAAEAMADGGRIRIATRNCYIDKPVNGYDSVREGEYVVLSVADTGIGISKQDIDKIFEPFYTKKVMGRSGTGLGMAVVWGAVKDQKGYIDIESAVGEGTTVRLYLPVSRAKTTSEEARVRMQDYMGNGESILVVDDVKEQREIASTMLATLGYNVDTVPSGEAAVAYARRNAVDLVVLDMIMDPGINGRETYEKIIAVRPGQKAVIASGFSETEEVKAAQQMGAGCYIKKPYTLDNIGMAINRELRR